MNPPSFAPLPDHPSLEVLSAARAEALAVLDAVPFFGRPEAESAIVAAVDRLVKINDARPAELRIAVPPYGGEGRS